MTTFGNDPAVQEQEDLWDAIAANDTDPFGFADAVQVDHLTDEQVDLVAAMFDKEDK